MRALYFDCFSGASGDMLLAALIDAGAPEAEVRRALEALDLQGWSLDVTDTARAGMQAARARVAVTGSGPARTYRDVVALVERAGLPDGIARRVLDVFGRLASAEAGVHGVDVANVHLHEVGATDALVDVVGVAAALEYLAPERCYCSPIATGTGTVETDHGTLPLPAPAVAELLRGIPIYGRGRDELVTPTGAAILVHACSSFGELPDMRIEAIGYGAGARSDGTPNIVRVLVGDVSAVDGERLVLLETNLDDLVPEMVPHVIDRLMDAGALDVWATPVIMKRGRPGILLSALADEAGRDAIVRELFRETTTLGIRTSAVDRRALERAIIEVEVSGAPVRVKIGILEGDAINYAPEFRDAQRVAVKLDRPLKDVYADALESARRAWRQQKRPRSP